MPHFPRSVRARLTLWYTLVLSLPLAAFAAVSYYSFSRILNSRTDAFLSEALTVFSNELMVERRQIPSVEEAIRTTVREVRFRDLDIVVLDGGEILASSSTVLHAPPPQGTGDVLDSPTLLAAVRSGSTEEPWVRTLRGSGGAFRLRVAPLPVGERRFTLSAVYPLVEVEETLRGIRNLFVTTIPLLIVLAGLGGWFLARRSFRPVSAMAARAAEISANTLHERLPVLVEDELGELAAVLNDLLDRLQRSFAQQRRFMADASHELRSPAAILRTEADVTLSREHRTEEEYRESMLIVQDAARRLTRVVDDLFFLARADGGHPLLHRGPLYLEDVVRDTVRTVRPLGDRKGVQVEITSMVEAPFRGDPDLLGRAVLNLLDNAIKHSAEGGRVEVTLDRRDDDLEILVADQGPGIPAEARARVFERFFRVDSARSRGESSLTSGAGLGLAISRSILEMHGGSLDLRMSEPGRTVFALVLPADPDL